jgi:hypothetical protein
MEELAEDLKTANALLAHKDREIKKLEKHYLQSTLYQQKVESLEQELFTLAQKKLLIKKESQELFKKLESN